MRCVDGLFFCLSLSFSLPSMGTSSAVIKCSFPAKFLHLKQTICEILTCKIETDERKETKNKWKERNGNNLIWKTVSSNHWVTGCAIVMLTFSLQTWSNPWFWHCFRCKLLSVALKTICTIWCWWRQLQNA